MGLACEIDPQFKPKKGSQIQTLRNDVDELKAKLELLRKNESFIAKALLRKDQQGSSLSPLTNPMTRLASESSYPIVAKTFLKAEPQLQPSETYTEPSVGLTSSPNIQEFILGDVRLLLAQANELHTRFINDYLPFLPILSSKSATELYLQSQLLFWTVCLTACLLNPEPSLYNRLLALIKQLAIETCWLRTPRLTHIAQLLLILSCWPLPNQKVLDDCLYRFVGLARSLGLQLGLHRGKFISEFSRTQVSLVNAEKWRTRTWLVVFFCEQLWASILGLPPCAQPDYLVESARTDTSLPKNFRCLVCLLVFQLKMTNIMGSLVTLPDGLMAAQNRAGSLNILVRELERLVDKLQIDDPITEMYYLYVKLLVCAFAFLPETPTEDQAKYVTIAYHAATRIVTIFLKLVEVKQLSEYPVYVRHLVTFACFTLFKLHLTPLLLDKYVDSARQLIVTVHRLFRNMLAAWKDVDNDISRMAKVLEKLNYVILTQPGIFLEGEGIIKTNRSHLSNSLFYDLVACIHEARRRNMAKEQAQMRGQPVPGFGQKPTQNGRKLVPLPFYNQITRDSFKTILLTSPNGTTVTTLVPTQSAMSSAQADATANGLAGPTKINGIPLPLLEATGSLKRAKSPELFLDEKPFQNINSLFDYDKLDVPMERAASSNSGVGEFMQQQLSNWTEGNDDLLGWFDVNMSPEF